MGVPPDGTLLSSMLYEGFIKILGECQHQLTKDCVKTKLIQEINDKKVEFRFVKNDISSVGFKKLDEDLVEFLFSSVDNIDLNIKIELCREGSKNKLRVFASSYSKASKEYSLQIMKTERYKGISILELGTMNKQITTFSDANALIVFFFGLVSSYILTLGNYYYFLFFDTETLLTDVVKGQPKGWMDLKNNLVSKFREVIEKLGGLDDETISLVVLLNTYLVETLKNHNISYLGFRLVKIRREGHTYKIYADVPIRIYSTHRLYENLAKVKRLSDVLEELIEPAGKYIRGKDTIGDGYHAFRAIKYLYNYIMSESPVYLTYVFRELHEAYEKAKEKRARHAEGYLKCLLKMPTYW